MITELLTFTKEERTDIAEFIFSYQTDVLIKSDALRLVHVLVKHNLLVNEEMWIEYINDQRLGTADDLANLLAQVISSEVTAYIMNEYYGQKYNK